MITSDTARLPELEDELEQIRQRIALLVPESPRPYEPTQMALIFVAQAASGCQQAAKYMREAEREAMGDGDGQE